MIEWRCVHCNYARPVGGVVGILTIMYMKRDATGVLLRVLSMGSYL